MEIIFVMMIMFSFGLLSAGIGDYVKKKTIIDRNKPREVWERDIEDYRYYSKNRLESGSDYKNKIMNEYILCAAVWYKDIPIKKEIPHSVRPVNCDRGLVFCGFRHAHCIYTMVSVTGIRSVETEIGEYVQGFLTSKNRFVDREEGAKIHVANGHKIDFENRLFSEDLY